MLPRLRFVVASLVIALLPMVFLGAGLAPTAHTSPAELSRTDRPIVLGPTEYSEAQYRSDRHALSYARRATELNKLRELASVPLANWIAAPAGAEPDNAGDASVDKVATVTTAGASVVTVSTVTPTADKPSDVTVSVTVSPIDKRAPEVTIEAPTAETKPAADEKTAAAKPEARADTPATPSTTDVPRPAAGAVAPGQTYAALNPATPKVEPSNLPQVHVVTNRSKPRARVARRAKPVPPLPQAAQKPPPFFELFTWLFNIQPQPAQTRPQTAPLAQRPQVRSSVTPATPFRTAAQP